MISPGGRAPLAACGRDLCGGRSERGVPKAGMLLPDGRSMLERTHCSRSRGIVLLGDPHGIAGHDALEDRRPGLGPLAAIESLLEATSTRSTSWFDLPLMQAPS